MDRYFSGPTLKRQLTIFGPVFPLLSKKKRGKGVQERSFGGGPPDVDKCLGMWSL